MAGSLIALFNKTYSTGARIEADLCLDSEREGVTVLFGPSGSGKTTILRCLAGLETPQEGFIRFDEQTWFDRAEGINRPPQRRQLAYVAQDYGLFPHLTVEQNVTFGMAVELGDKHRRASALIGTMHLSGLERRFPGQLSGGERQRVALARALAREPKLVLLDEPLAAVDLTLRDALRRELRQFLTSLDVPSIVVTHDRTDALALGDRLAVMAQGRIRQIGPVHDVFSRPTDLAVASIVGVETVVPGRVVGASAGMVQVQVGSCVVLASDPGQTGRDVFVCIRAEDVILEKTSRVQMSARNQLPGRIVGVQSQGPVMRVVLDCGFPLTALVTRPAAEDLGLAADAPTIAVVKATAIHLIDRGDGAHDRTGDARDSKSALRN
jgi:molybdate transport system ATP-binding protein